MILWLCLLSCARVCAALQPQQQQATAQTTGIAPLVQSAVLTDRRHILTKDAEGNVELWDVLTGAVEERFGQVMHLLVSSWTVYCGCASLCSSAIMQTLLLAHLPNLHHTSKAAKYIIATTACTCVPQHF